MANPTIRGTVLVVEDSETRISWFKERLPSALIASKPVDAVRALASGTPDTVFLDFDLGPGINSLGVASMLADAPPRLCIIHSANEDGARELAKLLPGALILPYASFEIAGNAIQPRNA
jgi:DNA-binding LytR/AlgR family response regulator